MGRPTLHTQEKQWKTKAFEMRRDKRIIEIRQKKPYEMNTSLIQQASTILKEFFLYS